MHKKHTVTRIALAVAITLLAPCAVIPGEHTVATSFVVTRISPIIPRPSNKDVYPMVNPGERFAYGRSHVFEYATFGGSLEEGAKNREYIRPIPGFYPGTSNEETRNRNEAFICLVRVKYDPLVLQSMIVDHTLPIIYWG